MKNMSRVRVAAIVGAALFVIPLLSFAQEDQPQSGGYCPRLYSDIKRGDRDSTTGGQVTELQKFLTDYYDLNPETYVTGYFGRLTQANVIRFQKEQNLPAYGYVGRLTRAAIARVCGGSSYLQGTYYSQSSYYTQGSYSSNVNFIASPTSGAAPLAVVFNVKIGDAASGSFSVEFGDGSSGPIYLFSCGAPAGVPCPVVYTANHIYTQQGTYTAKLTIPAMGCEPVDCNVKGKVTIIVTPTQTGFSCTSDAHCPSSNYTCEAIEGEGYGTLCARTTSGQVVDPNCRETYTITKGVCKVKEGRSCSSTAECASGNRCYMGICTNPVGRVCSGASDASCGYGWQCIQDCGSPVPSQYDPPPGYHCVLNEYAAKPRVCPICLAGSTLIDTPAGKVSVKNLQKGMLVWTTDSALNRISGIIAATSKVSVSNHAVVTLVLSDGREVLVSAGHPTADGRTVGVLKAGDTYDGASVISAERVAYNEDATYDILPSGATGFYWADGILLGSTLKAR